MAAATRVYALTSVQVGALQQILRMATLLAGSVARQEISQMILDLVKARTPEQIALIEKAPEKVVESLTLNREHLGAIKLALIDIWRSQNSSGGVREIIADLSGKSGFNIWASHILPNLPKEDNLSIDFDDETPDILSGDLPDSQAPTQGDAT